MKILIRLFFVLIALFIIYKIGPKSDFGPLESAKIEPWDISLDSLDLYVHLKDLELPELKRDNESRIIWVDSMRKTPYSIVYLHGFSASPMESHPTHVQFAKRFGLNMYIPLLAGHGRDTRESFKELTPNDLIRSAKEAVAIGQLLGDEVIVMSCSTGSTLALYLAGENPELIDALIMYSPNIELADPTAKLITGPWGEQILNMVVGEYWISKPEENDSTWEEGAKYWTVSYRSEGLIALQALLDDTMTDDVVEQIQQPYFIGYYYKNDEEQDPTISIPAILEFDKQTRTDPSKKRLVAFPDAGAHVITNPLKGRNVKAVLDSTIVFAERVLNLPSI